MKRRGNIELISVPIVYSNYGYQLGSERGVNVNTIREMLNSEVVSSEYLPRCEAPTLRWRLVLVYKEQWDDTAQKFDYNSFISATITISSGANPARVAQRCIAKDIRGLGSQSELAFNAIRCFNIYCQLLGSSVERG